MTYTDLLAAILAYIKRPEAEQLFPTFITMAEGELNRRLRTRKMLVRASDMTIDCGRIGLPADFLSCRSLTVNGRALQWTSPEKLDDDLGFWDREPGCPTQYSMLGDELVLSPVPNATFTASMTYYVALNPLGPTNASNWLLGDQPDLYVYGALKQAATFFPDQPGLTQAASMFEQILTQANAVRDDGALLSVGRRFAP